MPHDHAKPLVGPAFSGPAEAQEDDERTRLASAFYLSEPAVCPDLPFASITEREQEHFYRLADAALAARPSADTEALRRVRELADKWTDPGYYGLGRSDMLAALRAALDGDR